MGLSALLGPIGSIFGVIGDVSKAVTAFLGFEQRQQDKQAGIDAQTVKSEGLANKATQGELQAAVDAPKTKEDVVRRLGDGTA